MQVPPDEPITVPPRPEPIRPSPFPVVASIAPVVAAVVIWALTRSPFVLIFAALGPIIAVASVVDNRWSGRRRLRTDTAGWLAEIDRLNTDVDTRHAAEQKSRCSTSTSARRILDTPDAPTIGFGRWRVPAARQKSVVVGRGAQPSALRVDGPQGPETARLKARARLVPDVPVEVDAGGGIGLVGPPLLASAIARGLLVQLCSASSPDALAVLELPSGWDWADALPHRRSRAAAASVAVVESAPAAGPLPPADALLVLAERLDRIPTRCSSVIELTGVTTAVLHRTGTTGLAEPLDLHVELISVAEAGAFARMLEGHASRLGDGDTGALPAVVGFAEMAVAAPPPRPSGSLSAVIGSSSGGPVCVDIVTDGPHAIVGGTTGSGKSELLVTWATSLAERYPPEVVTLLLVDFKGGAAFAPLLGLPHVVGVLTDLDGGSAIRALDSLRAEVRYRERMLRDLGVRDIAQAQAQALARLVIVVDEFAAMLDGFPELHALFVDIAARGRSLGLHLILCTQRPAGVVKDSLLANCGLRMSLRVNNRADSIAILATDAAVMLPASIPGRLVLATGATPVTLQVATATETDIARAAGAWRSVAEVRRPWLEPLPPWVERSSLGEPADDIRLGLADLPTEQRQETVCWDPVADGSMLVIGMAQTGKTTLLNTIEREATRLDRWVVERIGSDAELAWDVVMARSAALSSSHIDGPPVLILLDDLDSLLAGIDPEAASDLRDGVVALLRDGPRRGVHLAITLQRLAGPTAMLGGFVGSTVLLGTANRQEHILAGGSAAGWVESRRPGSALWRGTSVQLAAPEPARLPAKHAASRTVRPVRWDEHPLTLVVSNAPKRRADEILMWNATHQPVGVAVLGDTASGRLSIDHVRGRSGGPVALVGDPEEWQGQWSLLTALRQDAAIIIDGCTVAEFRAITRIRTRPPLLSRLPGRAWFVEPGGEVTRVSLAPPPRS